MKNIERAGLERIGLLIDKKIESVFIDMLRSGQTETQWKVRMNHFKELIGASKLIRGTLAGKTPEQILAAMEPKDEQKIVSYEERRSSIPGLGLDAELQLRFVERNYPYLLYG